jgi:membrane associated rhomboid family serine protease
MAEEQVQQKSVYLAAPFTLAVAGALCAIFVAQRLSGVWSGDLTILQRPLVYSLHGLARGELWRIFTPNLTNGPAYFDLFHVPGLGHLAVNVLGLLAAGPAVERRLGRFRFLTVFVVAGAVAYGWLVLPLPPADNFDGTSGAIFGICGAFVALALFNGHRERRVILVLVALFTLGGFSPRFGEVTKEIHLGGLVAGVLLALLFQRFREPTAAIYAAIVVIAMLCGLVALRTPEIKTMDLRLHPRPVGLGPVGPVGPVATEAYGRHQTVRGSVDTSVRAGRRLFGALSL